MKQPNAKQKHFVELYLQTGNATQSYIEAFQVVDAEVGSRRYRNARGSAWALLQYEHMQEYIKQVLQEVSPLANIDFIQTKVIDIICNEDSTVGEQLKALELLAKITGALNHKQELSIDHSNVVLTILPSEEE